MLKQLAFCLLLLSLHKHVTTSRILAVISTSSYSHQMFYQQLWRELAIRGHDIVVITSDPTNETLPNFKEISIAETYMFNKKYMKDIIETNVVKLFWTNRMMEVMMEGFEFVLRLPQVQEVINNHTEYFDLFIVEHFIGPVLGFQHRFNCPMIGVASFDTMDPVHEVMGNPVHSLLYPMSLMNIDISSSVFARLVMIIINGLVNLGPYRNNEQMDAIARDIFGADTPPVMKLLERTDMLFVNVNPLFNAIRPHTPSTISTAGGMLMKPAKPLPKDLQTFLDNANEGVVYFSLGSNVKSNQLSEELRGKILESLGQLPYKVLWKFEDDSLVGKPNNVELIKWAPQQDVLRHKNVKLFVTQGGLQSLEETLYLHVPVVVMPFFADQDVNALRVQNKGWGLVVNKENFKGDDLKSAILEVINNPVYKETVTRLATQIQDSPMSALDRAVWWTEYVLRHKGAQHLKGPVIPYYQYYYLDVLLVLSVVALLILGLTFVVGRFFYRMLSLLIFRSRDKTRSTHKLKSM